VKAVSFGRDGSERCRPGLQVEGNEEAWPQPVPGTRGGGVHHHRIFGLLPSLVAVSSSKEVQEPAKKTAMEMSPLAPAPRCGLAAGARTGRGYDGRLPSRAVGRHGLLVGWSTPLQGSQ